MTVADAAGVDPAAAPVLGYGLLAVAALINALLVRRIHRELRGAGRRREALPGQRL